MLIRLIALNDNNAAIWQALLAYADIATKVKSCSTDITGLLQVQERDLKGITTTTAVIREDLLKATRKLINGLVAYAHYNDLHTLLAEVNYTESALKKERDTEFYNTALFIQNKAQEYETQLADFLIKPTDITAQAGLVNQYDQAMPQRGVAGSVSKTATADLKLKFSEARQLLQKLDKLVLLFKDDHPTFVEQYFNARIIVDLGHRSSKNKTMIVGTVTNIQDDKPIEGVNVWVDATGLSHLTGPDGSFAFELPKAGDYIIKAQKDKFSLYISETYKVETGQEITLEIELEPAT
ncbi:MAG: carboxypeptidase-like regulatory domain-containing protein [Bacteroidales bacterium]